MEGKNCVLLIVVVLMCFITLEGGLRAYYALYGGEIAADDWELCMREKSADLKYRQSQGLPLYYSTEKSIHTFHPQLGIWHIPHYTQLGQYADTGNVLYRLNTNGDGMRGEVDYSIEVPHGVTRFVHLGDSMTWGDKSATRNSFPSLLENITAGTQMLNLGVNGAGVDDMYLVYKTIAKRYDTDYIVLNILTNDVLRVQHQCNRPHVSVVNGKLEVTNYPLATIEDFLAYKPPRWESYAYKWLIYRISHFGYKRQLIEEGFSMLPVIIHELESYAPVIITIIVPKNYQDSEEDQEIRRRLLDMGRELNVPVIDTFPALLLEAEKYGDGSIDMYYYDDGHFHAAGNALVARIINNKLADWKMVARSPVDFIGWDIDKGLLVFQSSGRTLWKLVDHDLITDKALIASLWNQSGEHIIKETYTPSIARSS